MPSVGEAIAFNGAAGGTPPITITWDFGDGAAGRGPAVSHTFDQLGDYLVTMTATNCGREPVVAEHRIRVHIHVRLPLILRGR
jgi:PKD repeat protein